MKVAIVHDWLVAFGGAERVLEVLLELFPDAPVFTSLADLSKLPPSIAGRDVRTSFINKLPFAKKRYREYLPLMPVAFEQFDLSEFDLVISNSHSCAKGVITSPSTCHICYCLTPMRYAWDMYYEYLKIENIGWLKKKMIPLFMKNLRVWDVSSSVRVDYYIAISSFIVHRIKKYYGRDSFVIYPPVETGKFLPSEPVEDYFLVVSRLIPQKRIDIIVKAFNDLGLPLKIIGSGRELKRLKNAAKQNIEFLGFQADEVIAKYLRKCRAFIFASREDFGIAPIEAMSCGRPVIAYAAGGAKESIMAEKTGVFFDKQEEESLIDAVERFKNIEFDSKFIREHAEKFGREVFKNKISNYINEKYREYHCSLGEGDLPLGRWVREENK